MAEPEKAEETTVPVPDEAEAQKERQAKLEEKAINEANASADSMYVPSPSTLASPSPNQLMEQVDGISLDKYESSPNIYTAHKVPVAAGVKFEVPIQVSSGGSVVEYSVESERYDISLGIVAEREEKETVVKALEIVDTNVKPCTGKFLVGTVPCVLMFTFDNSYSWVRQKEVTYKIIVTPPSKENLMLGRRRRANAAIKSVREDLLNAENRLSTAEKEKATLKDIVEKLEKELFKQKAGYDAVSEEVEMLNKRVTLRNTQSSMLSDRIDNGWKDEEEKSS